MAKQWKCYWCDMVITTTGSEPDRKAGGPCPRNPGGDHNWTSA